MSWLSWPPAGHMTHVTCCVLQDERCVRGDLLSQTLSPLSDPGPGQQQVPNPVDPADQADPVGPD